MKNSYPINIMNCQTAFAVPGSDSLIDCIHPVTGKSWINGETLEQIQLRHPGAEVVNIGEHFAARSRFHLHRPQVHDQLCIRDASAEGPRWPQEVGAVGRLSFERDPEGVECEPVLRGVEARSVGGDESAAVSQAPADLRAQIPGNGDGVGQHQQSVRGQIALRVDHVELVSALLQHSYRAHGGGGLGLTRELLRREHADLADRASAAAPGLFLLDFR